MNLIVDGHADIAWNALSFGRDVNRAAAETRRLEVGSQTPAHNGQALLGYPDWVRGRVALVIASLFATPARRRREAWDTVCYADAEEAYRWGQASLEVYRRLAGEHPDRFRQVCTRADLEAVLSTWEGESTSAPQVGLVLSMEGADAVRRPQELPDWYAAGVRILGPAWAGTRYAGGTHEPGPLTPKGRRLLAVMAELGMVLDLSHLAEEACLEALDRYEGALLASHSNARALLDGSPTPDRHLGDAAIDRIAQRGGVIGVVPYNRFLKGGWKPADGRQVVPLERVVRQVDYLCQRIGDAAHVGLGSDFEGGFGLEMIPAGLDTVADLRLIGEALAAAGYSPADVAAMLGGNWLRLLRRALPES